ncbi:MAG: bifunctional 2-C-methyl-D-erythritol 4-phosphate cytidylyltransferase/2-C-methyl-D-erythritol 2,4-cyclodiphosphate synthase [Bauldia sp.]|nr:bifunctional 2-C-methyl-D-erythritol 4-phosphate cytidylyltransferase/2-C-methyl-D-erythritol 2,4-cyclodiphosphate synthase [Bauldia sp.]
MTETVALIVAAGQGTRAGGDVPKQYRSIGGIPLLRRSMQAFVEHPDVDRVVVAVAPGDTRYRDIASQQDDRLLPPVSGGATRQETVRLGLQSLRSRHPARVLIHDAARPYASHDLIGRVLEALNTGDAVIPALPVPATLKAVGSDGIILRTVPREGIQAAETPQGFHFDPILAAHEKAAATGELFTDDAAVAEWAGMTVRVVAGESGNVKITSSDDIAAADRRANAEAAWMLGDVRVGTGFDVHAFGPGSAVMLGGVSIPHTRGVVGHSDADVALHALTDAVLGALAEGDIGAHFPPSDPQWKGVSSDRFLRFAAERVAARGGRIAHLDLVIVTEGPRLSAHRDAIRARIAAICGIRIDRVGVKATTNENLGFIGRGEGLAAYASATVRLPFGPDA